MKRATCLTSKGCGFTLVELLVAVSVLSITMMLAYGVYASMFSVVDHVERSGSAKRAAFLLFDQLQRDISGLYKGASGDFKAEAPANTDGDSPFLQFVTSSHLYFDSSTMKPELVRVAYSLEKSENDSTYDLYRAEYRFELSDASGSFSTPVRLRVGAGINELSISYKDGYGSFLDRWQIRSGGEPGGFDDSRYPSLIRVEMTSGGHDEMSANSPSFFASFSVYAAQIGRPGSGEDG